MARRDCVPVAGVEVRGPPRVRGSPGRLAGQTSLMSTFAGQVVGSDGAARNETELERCDRNLVELLQEVRVVQTGVQVLFAFLLTANSTWTPVWTTRT